MAQLTKGELLEELAPRVTKEELVKLLDNHLKKDELAGVLDEEGEATKAELVHKLASQTKSVLVDALGQHLTRDELQRVYDSHAPKNDDTDARPRRGTTRTRQPERRDGRSERGNSGDLDWNAELDWAPPPLPTPAPVAYTGPAPFMPGQRVRVDLSGLPMLGVFAGKGASAAGTIVGVDARERSVRVYLDAAFDGEKELMLPPERVTPDA